MADQQESSLGNLMSLIQAFTGKSTNTTSGVGTSTTTTHSTLTDADAQKLVQSLLEGNSGLAQVAGGQVGSGMYNSTVNSQLTNDLLARISAQVAANNADKIVTTTTPKTTSTVTTPGLGLGGAATIGALALGKNLLDPILSGKKGVGSSLDIFSGGGSSDSVGSSAFTEGAGFNTADWGNYTTSEPSSDYSSLFGSLSDSISSFGDNISSLFGVGDNSVISNAVIDSGSSMMDTADSSGDWFSGIKDFFGF